MLMELIAVERIVQEVREVVPEIERTLDGVEIKLRRPCLIRLRPAAGQRKPIGISSISRIERAVQADLAGSNCARWDLVGRIPLARIRHARDREAVLGSASAVAHYCIELTQVIRVIPRAVVGSRFSGDKQRAIADFGGGSAKAPV